MKDAVKLLLPVGYQYIGCFIVTITSLLVVIIYLQINADKATGEKEGSQQPSASTILKHAHDLAQRNDSFLSYLKQMDGHSQWQFPVHCRTIDFYLACRSTDNDNTEQATTTDPQSDEDDP